MPHSETETSEKKALKFAIIIPITHSLYDLDLCLSSLEKINYSKDNFQVVLINCHKASGLKDFEKKLPEYNLQIEMLHLPQKELHKLSWINDERNGEAYNNAINTVKADYYIFTEDDCLFEPDWLLKFEPWLSEDLGMLMGPEILAPNLPWFARVLDCVLISFLGTGGRKNKKTMDAKWYYPQNENMLIPAKVFEQVGYFAEHLLSRSEIEMFKTIRDAGLKTQYLEDNYLNIALNESKLTNNVLKSVS